MEQIDGLKTVIFVRVTLYLLPLFIKCLIADGSTSLYNACQKKIMSRYFRLVTA